MVLLSFKRLILIFALCIAVVACSSTQRLSRTSPAEKDGIKLVLLDIDESDYFYYRGKIQVKLGRNEGVFQTFDLVMQNQSKETVTLGMRSTRATLTDGSEVNVSYVDYCCGYWDRMVGAFGEQKGYLPYKDVELPPGGVAKRTFYFQTQPENSVFSIEFFQIDYKKRKYEHFFHFPIAGDPERNSIR